MSRRQFVVKRKRAEVARAKYLARELVKVRLVVKAEKKPC